MAKKTWIEKYKLGRQAEVKRANKAMAGIPAGSLMLIPTPQVVGDYIRSLPEGTFVDTPTIRKDLALQYGAEYTCPVTTGIFLRIVSEAAYEELQAGKSSDEVVPFWRAVAPGSPTAKKLTFGEELITRQRELEKN